MNLKTPFQFDGGRVAVTSSPDTVARQKIIDVLTTSKFERVMNSQYGTGINTVIFEIMNDMVFSDFKSDAITALRESVSRVEILDIKIDVPDLTTTLSGDETTVTVGVVYQLPLGSPSVVGYSVAIPDFLDEETPI